MIDLKLTPSTTTNSSLCDVFGGNIELGNLIASVQSIKIKIGYELETQICSIINKNNEIYRHHKTTINKTTIEADIIDCTNKRIIEIKNGVNFDTKKSKGELSSLSKLYDYYNHLDYKCYFVSWDAITYDAIISGMKLKRNEQPENIEFLTGQMFADLYEFDYTIPQKNIHNKTQENIQIFKNYFNNIDFTKQKQTKSCNCEPRVLF